jgi:hypothetical protein
MRLLSSYHTGVAWLLYGQNPGLAALSWALVHPRASPWPSLGIWPIRCVALEPVALLSAAGTIYKRN